MPKNKVAQEDLAVLLKIDLLRFLGTTQKEKEKERFIKRFNELCWIFFFSTDGKNLPKNEIASLEELLKNKNYDGAMRYLQEKYPDLKVRMIKNTLLAKKVVILEALDYVITIVKAKARATKQEDPSEKFIELLKLAENDKWVDFSKLLISIEKA